MSSFLGQNIVSIYEITSFEEVIRYKTIPNGLIGFTVLTHGSARHYHKNEWINISKSSIYGLIKKPGIIEMNCNSRDISVAFNPVFFSSFLEIPLEDLAGAFVDATTVFSKNDVEVLENKLTAHSSDTEIINAIEKFLISYFNGKIDSQLCMLYNKILRGEFNRVSAISELTNVSSRTLLSKFKNKVGLSPKDLMMISRINSALSFEVHKPTSLTDLAYKLGYFDQAHFIHDFKSTIGLSPEDYFKNNGLISDFYNSGRWNLISFV